ncbi:microsomal signal peptidase protein subunit [Sporothrix brasiliensis 5110]|uniref:Signal peptidase complex subunit 3 n=1 Tax=Sporothrix brasiliensis 5110 TaxID=1398154 RepID=A0A0C2FAC4_9PEZI|nr:microsomal signal peptidase protein subunit [Sporothrix brasiliensis 5110]KIH88033.1 microsomal signal peptidase protein subunit [Sporothrix brasiliensis 5110]
MHSSLVRLQNVFGFFTTVVTVIACLIAVTDLLHARTPSATVRPAGLQVVRGRPHYYSKKKEEYAVVRFHLDADLSSLFTWNTKQVFVYVTAEWGDEHANATEATNTAVIWDKIITSPSSDHLANIGPVAMRKLRKSSEGKAIDPSRGILHLKNQKPKYQITHPSGKIAETEQVRLRVHYNVQPWVGMLSWNQYSGDGSISSWLLPQRGGAGSPLWQPLAGGESKAFELPAVGASGSASKKAKAAESSV